MVKREQDKCNDIIPMQLPTAEEAARIVNYNPLKYFVISLKIITDVSEFVLLG